MKKQRLIALFLAAAMCVGLLAGCKDSSADNSQQPPADVSEPAGVTPSEGVENTTGIVPGSVFNVGYGTQQTVHLPYMGATYAYICLQLYDTLFYYKNGDPNQLEGLMAESWELDEDGLGCTVKIHDNIKFYNGKACTAHTIIDCWETTKEKMPTMFANVESVTAEDDYTLRFEFNGPFATFFDTFANTMTGIVDPDAIAQYGAESNDAAVGTGPYYVSNYVAGEVVTLTANPYYWHEDRMPQVETVNIYNITDANTALSSLQTGSLDMYETSEVQVMYDMENVPSMKIYTVTQQNLTLWFNEKHHPALANTDVRAAITHLIDWQALVDIMYDGYYEPITSIWQSGTAGAVETDMFSYDPDLAMELFDRAGVDPSTLSLHILTYPRYQNTWVILQNQLAQVGIELTIDTYEYATATAVWVSGDWDLAPGWANYTAANPLNGFTQGVIAGGSMPSVFFDECLPDVDARINELYQQAYSATTKDEQAGYLREMTTLLQDNYASPGGIETRKWIGMRENFSNLIYESNVYYPLFNYIRIAE